MDERFTGLCPVTACPFRHKADAEMLSSVLTMHLRDAHKFTISESTPLAALAVKQGQEIAVKVSRVGLALAEVFGTVSESQSRAVLREMAGQGLAVRVSPPNPRAAQRVQVPCVARSGEPTLT